MPHFSRLTEIVTCNLTAILAEAADKRATLEEILSEMREGVAGAQRSAKTAGINFARIEGEIAEQQTQIAKWLDRAKQSLAVQDEDKARQALLRKKEHESLIAGLEQQRTAARTTRDHLTTTLHALEARLADAERRLADLRGVDRPEAKSAAAALGAAVDEELAALKREVSGR
jgi:phage shock protein A